MLYKKGYSATLWIFCCTHMCSYLNCWCGREYYRKMLMLTHCQLFLLSLPSEVCTIISDADCITPVETICNAATPSPDCQLVLRQFFNDSGVFCINVSLTNDVSLAVASARVSVSVGE